MGVHNNIDSRLARADLRTDVVDATPTSATPDLSCLPAVTNGASVLATELAGARTRLWNGPDLIPRGLARVQPEKRERTGIPLADRGSP